MFRVDEERKEADRSFSSKEVVEEKDVFDDRERVRLYTARRSLEGVRGGADRVAQVGGTLLTVMMAN